MAKRKHREGTYETLVGGNGKKVYRWKIRLGSLPNQVTRVRSACSMEALRLKVQKCLRELSEAGHIASGSTPRFGAFYDRWLEDFVEPTVRPRTFQSYEQMGRTQVKPRLGEMALHKVTGLDVQRALNDMGSDGLSAATRRYCLRLVKMCLDQAIALGLVVTNVAKAAKAPPEGETTKRVLLSDEVGRLRRALLGCRYEPFITLMLFTGARPSECAGLLRTKVDFRQLQIHLHYQLADLKERTLSSGRIAKPVLPEGSVAIGDSRYLVPVKTKKSRRTIDMHPEAQAALGRQLALGATDKVRAGAYHAETGLIFASETGRPVSLRNVQRSLDSALKRAGIEHVSLHDLRKTFTSHLTGEIHEIQAILGHSHIGTTEKHYLEVQKARKKSIIMRLNFDGLGPNAAVDDSSAIRS